MDGLKVRSFIDEPISVRFDVPPARAKSPSCPQAFIWRGEEHGVAAMLAEWHDFSRRGRMARNMSPAHAAATAGRGSLGVGRFYFRVSTATGRVFDLYYDRAVKDADHRAGGWVLYRELEE